MSGVRITPLSRASFVGSQATIELEGRLTTHLTVWTSSRHPETLHGLVESLGPRASVGTPAEAARFADVVMLTVPLRAIPDLAVNLAPLLAGKIVIDTSNAYAKRTRDTLVWGVVSDARRWNRHALTDAPGASRLCASATVRPAQSSVDISKPAICGQRKPGNCPGRRVATACSSFSCLIGSLTASPHCRRIFGQRLNELAKQSGERSRSMTSAAFLQ